MKRFFLVLTAVSLLQSCSEGTDAAVEKMYGEETPVVKIRSALVTRGEVTSSLEVTAIVKGGKQANLVPDISGKIVRIPVKVGDVVKAGTLLASLDSEMIRAQLKQAEAGAAIADLSFERALKEFERARTLHENGSMTDQQFEQVTLAYQIAAHQKEQASAALQIARKNLEGSFLTAPFEGVVSRICCEEGEFFSPMSVAGAQGLVTLVNIDRVRLDFSVSENHVSSIYVGMPAKIRVRSETPGEADRYIDGEVETVGRAADPSSLAFPVRVTADNSDHLLKTGTSAVVHLVLDRRSGVISVPEAALLREEGRSFVMKVEGDRARKIPVETGLHGNGVIEIVSGLNEGDRVVVEGAFGLPEGARVSEKE